MIALSWLFLLVAIGSLIVGVFSDLVWVYVSIGASVIAMILLLFGIIRRKPVQPATAGAPYGPAVGTPEARSSTPAAAATATAATAAAAPAQRRPATPAATKAPASKPPAKKTAAKKTAAKAPATKSTAAKKTPAKKTAAASSSARGTVVAIPERGTYHKATCRYVQGRTDTENLKAATAKSRGFKACGVCKP